MREQTQLSAVELLDKTTGDLAEQTNKQIALIQASGPHLSTPVNEEKGETVVFSLNPSAIAWFTWVAAKASARK